MITNTSMLSVWWHKNGQTVMHPFTILASLCRWAGWFWYDLFETPEDKFSFVAAKIYFTCLLVNYSKGPVSIRPVSRPLWISFKLFVIKVAYLSCYIMKCWINRWSFLSCILIWSGWGNSTPNRVTLRKRLYFYNHM